VKISQDQFAVHERPTYLPASYLVDKVLKHPAGRMQDIL